MAENEKKKGAKTKKLSVKLFPDFSKQTSITFFYEL